MLRRQDTEASASTSSNSNSNSLLTPSASAVVPATLPPPRKGGTKYQNQYHGKYAALARTSSSCRQVIMIIGAIVTLISLNMPWKDDNDNSAQSSSIVLLSPTAMEESFSLSADRPNSISNRNSISGEIITENTPRTMLRTEAKLTMSTDVNVAMDMDMDGLRKAFPPSVWTLAGANSDSETSQIVQDSLSRESKARAMKLCGTFLYSSIRRAASVRDIGQATSTFVSTGDIPYMWTRDSAVQMGIYVGRMHTQKWLRLIVEGAIRRQAFNIIQDPYANAYYQSWVDPSTLALRERVIGRGGWVATRNFELDSGAYFMTQLYDYYVAKGLYKPDVLLAETMIFDAVMLMVDTFIVEQHHEEQSPYRYFELPRNGMGHPTAYTGMIWSGFRPSDDPCEYGYLIPANIHAAAGLERVLELNKRIWKSEDLEKKAKKLLREVAQGIQRHGTVERAGEKIYAYEVDGKGHVVADFDDPNVPSLLSIPLLGWSGCDRDVYRATRKRLLSPEINKFYLDNAAFRGQASPHTPKGFVWPMSFVIEALTEEGTKQELAASHLFQLTQSLNAACNDSAHEGVNSKTGCTGGIGGFSRAWFEWSNVLFVVLVESVLGEQCDAIGQSDILDEQAAMGEKAHTNFFSNKYKNDHRVPKFYLGVEAQVRHFD
jgi:meiotically up-regulated gene 157 (Mug157) protein